MADGSRMALPEVLRKAQLDHNADFLQGGVRVLSQALMELEVAEHLGAGRHERTAGEPASAAATTIGPGIPGSARSSSAWSPRPSSSPSPSARAGSGGSLGARRGPQ